jgi:glucose-6-phosphate 1-epimerase
MDLQSLTDHFALPGILAFDEPHPGMIRARINTPACTAELYLQGAHLTHWQPANQQPVLFLSERSAFTPGKAIRGGIPIIFPWFGPRTPLPDDPTPIPDQPPSPQHGFARTSPWTLAFAALAGDDLHLTLTLGPTDTSRALGYDHFQLACELILGVEIRLRLTVANSSEAPLHFEEAFHTYLSVGDARQVCLIGLSDTDFFDKTDNLKHKHQSDSVLSLTTETDRPYINTVNTINLNDPVLNRQVSVCKSNSKSTVIWNPWSALSATMSDMTPDGWQHMTCIETANIGPNAIALAPGAHHTMETHIFTQNFAPECTTDMLKAIHTTVPTPPSNP